MISFFKRGWQSDYEDREERKSRECYGVVFEGWGGWMAVKEPFRPRAVAAVLGGGVEENEEPPPLETLDGTERNRDLTGARAAVAQVRAA